MFLHFWHPQPLIGTIGTLQLHWYGLLLAIGAIAGLLVCRWLAKKYSISNNHIFDLFFYLLVFGFIGARLYHVTNEWAYYTAHPAEIMKIWNGGLALHGALIAGVIVLWLYTKAKKLNFWLMADILVVGMIVGQAIGRWGNYFNQELFGKPSNLPWSIPIDRFHRPIDFIDVQYFHPTFLYESLGSIIIAAMLIWIHRRRIKDKVGFWFYGSLTVLYFILYSILRLSLELLRIDRTPIIAGIRLPILTSAIIIIVAIIIWFTLKRSSSHVPPVKS